MAVNKVVYGGKTLVDLTSDTVTTDTLAEGATAHNASGNKITGTMKANTPTQFTNLYDPSNVTVRNVLKGSSSGATITADSYCNVVKIPFHHKKGEPVVLRLRGIGTVRDRYGCVVFAADGETRVQHYNFINSGSFALSYDEYGDVTITFAGGIITNYDWYWFGFNFQYPSVNKNATAMTGPIITINEPIGNGGHAG